MSRAYYNEIDPYAAQWLRNLISAGHIAPGDVDIRSIEDVRPEDLREYTQCHFFAGIGVWSHSLRRAGWPDDRRVWTGSCPCQPFSAAGKGAGFADERHLWPAWNWLITQCRPDVVFGEQVASKDGLAWLDVVHADLEAQGYAVGALDLCAAGVGAPHIRQRLYFVADTTSSRFSGRTRSAQTTGRDIRITQPLPRSEEISGPLAHPNQGRGGRNSRTISSAQESVEREMRSVVDGTKPSGATGELAVAANVRCNGRDTLAGRNGSGVAGSRRTGEKRRSTVELAGVRPEDFSAVDDAQHAGLEGQSGHGDNSHESGRKSSPSDRPASTAGATNGYWNPADWLPCIDGKARPVEPGTFPLAHGVASRVGRLRAYGNAIVAPLAETFIRAYTEDFG